MERLKEIDELTRTDSNLREEEEEEEEEEPEDLWIPYQPLSSRHRYARSSFFQELLRQHNVPESMFLIMEPCGRRRRREFSPLFFAC